MDAWLASARDEVAAAAGIPAGELTLDAGGERAVLELARIAAHESGERVNAPLLCYLAGRAVERGAGDVDDLLDAVRRVVP